MSDEEKQYPPLSEHDHLVEWDGPHDPLNPRNRPVMQKWLFVLVVSLGSLLVTCASSIYTLTYTQITEEFRCSQEVAILGLSMFVIGLAIGPMVLSPLSEFYGRRYIYIISVSFFLIWLIPCAVSQNIQTLIIARFLGGVSGSAFLSVSGGTVADLFQPSEIQAPMMLYTITPFVGPVLGPLIGGFINEFTTWRWTFYVLLIWTGLTLVSLILVPETYHPVLLARKAAAVRESTQNDNYYSASERANASKSISQTILHSLYRPFQLLLLEPMCSCLCLFSALLLGILYLFFGAFPLVFRVNHGFNLWETGLTFLGLMVGMLIGLSTNPIWHRNYIRLVSRSKIAADREQLKPDPEFRLPPAIAGVFCIPVGIFWFGWTTYSSVHWIVPIIGSIFFGLGMFLIFNGIFTFLVDAYPTYAASALAANTFLRCIFAASFPLFGEQMYDKLGFQWASTLLALLTVVMMPFPYLFFRYGKILRAKSRFASS
ncbi:multidrug resistance protein [Cadophora sp. DSE1049]|nr:multidrug resistance protein [Cadophora sp. DSE1049]